jgi:hypothetical protein
MLTPERLLRLIIEFIFILLGALLIWFAFAGPVYGEPSTGTASTG